MSRVFSVVFLAVSIVVVAACGGSAPPNSTAATNVDNRPPANGEVKLDPANMPPGLSGSPVPMTGNIPGIMANGTTLPKPTTPIPGIPSESELKKKKKPGTTPTPGIPDEETIRKAMGYRPRNANANRKP
ncbi:MAG TPA: hypothetical protein VNA17_06730 [Pyrinomonadaceae bacterium]|nr:hypothetical protein [Pyrinomonadaceae bacterium]